MAECPENPTGKHVFFRGKCLWCEIGEIRKGWDRERGYSPLDKEALTSVEEKKAEPARKKASLDEIRRKVDEYLELSKQMRRYADVGDWKQYEDLRVKRREIMYWLIDIDFLKETFLLI